MDKAKDFSQVLNPAQKKAVESHKGPYLVIAGAGTGKTRVLEYRTLKLIKSGVEPSSILLLTFTRRAASEMLSRAGRHDVRAQKVSGGTFHSFALSILKREGKLLGFESFNLIDRGDSEDLVGKIINDLKLREKKFFPKKGTVTDIISKSTNKERLISKILEKDYPHLSEWEKEIELVKMKYGKYKTEKNLMDYDDLLYFLAVLLEKFPTVRLKINQKYNFIMVDEYQDTNKLQARIIKFLSLDHSNILIVGDEMQSIYAFRGANFENMTDFPKLFPNLSQITLEENYRSTQEILSAANSLMEQVTGPAFRKYLRSERHGSKPLFLQFKSLKEEASYVAKKILSLSNEGLPLHQIAVLFRASYQSAPLELELSALRLPFKKFGGIRFIETAHVKDVLAHLRVIVNSKDEISWRRVLFLIEKIGEKTADRLILQILTEKNFKALDNSLTASLQRLLDLIKDEKLTPAEKMNQVFVYYQPILRRIYDDYPLREQDLSALSDIASSYVSLSEMLDDFTLEPPDASLAVFYGRKGFDQWVTLSTIHSAKGLEWNTVFIIGAQEGKFPVIRATTNENDIEEERRLFYVAITRAKERLFISSSQGRRDGYFQSWYFNKPSRFVEPLLEKGVLDSNIFLRKYSSNLDKDSFDQTIDEF